MNALSEETLRRHTVSEIDKGKRRITYVVGLCKCLGERDSIKKNFTKSCEGQNVVESRDRRLEGARHMEEYKYVFSVYVHFKDILSEDTRKSKSLPKSLKKETYYLKNL